MPGWQDIAKQMFYELAVRSVAGKAFTVSNCFAFPSRNDGAGPFVKVAMLPRDGGEPVVGFPSIDCHYIDVMNVMSAYVDRRVDLEFPMHSGISS